MRQLLYSTLVLFPLAGCVGPTYLTKADGTQTTETLEIVYAYERIQIACKGSKMSSPQGFMDPGTGAAMIPVDEAIALLNRSMDMWAMSMKNKHEVTLKALDLLVGACQ